MIAVSSAPIFKETPNLHFLFLQGEPTSFYRRR